MLHSIYRIALSVLILFSFSIFTTNAQTVSFNVTTVTYGGNYAPKHCFAMWITDSSGKFIKTINRQGGARVGYLTNWVSNSGQNVVDGTTGATITSHNYAYTSSSKTVSRIPFQWNCKDLNGNIVPDGTYFINVEFTEKNATGKTAKYTFVKGTSDQNLTFTNVSANFTNATLTYTAPIVSTINQTKNAADYKVFFSNSSKLLQLKYDAQYHESVVMTIYNEAGKSLYKKYQPDENFSVVLSKFTTGVYFVKFVDKSGKNQTNKIIVR